MFTYLKNVMYLALKYKKFEFWRACLGVNPLSWHPQVLLGLGYFWYLPIPKIWFIYVSKSFEVQNFGGPVWGGTLQSGTPNFSGAPVLPDIFNCSNFEYNALGSLKVDSQRRIRKKKKKEKKKQDSSWGKQT